MAKIMIVEDRAIICEEIKVTIELLKHEVVAIATTGEEAIEKVDRFRPDVVLMDIKLNSQMDGIQAAGVIYSKFDIPVIFLTAYLDEDLLNRAKLTMPFGYILKPVRERELKLTIEIALYKSEVHSGQKSAAIALQQSEQKYRHLVETMNDGLAVQDKNGLFTFVNNKFLQMIGYSKNEVTGHKVTDFLDKPNKKILQKQMRTGRKVKRLSYELVFTKKGGRKLHTIISRAPAFGEKHEYKGSFAVITDISELKKMEKKLRKREKALEINSIHLQESNNALKVLLRKSEADKIEVEEKVLSNVKELVSPLIRKMKNSLLDDKQLNLLHSIESNLQDIISPFSRQLSSKYSNLTPKEIQVAALVREGKSSKEIAESMASNKNMVDFHRKNLRKKLGLSNVKKNLRTFLMTLS